jgi:hypothetical protein
MNAFEIVRTYKVWRLLNRKHHVTETRLAKAVGKTPVLHAIKSVEDSFHVTIEKTEQGYHMVESEAKAPAPRARKAPVKKATKKAPSKKKAA